MSEEPRSSEPATGARWFPDEGGIMFRGKTYLPADYVFSRQDIHRAKAEAEAWLRDMRSIYIERYDGSSYLREGETAASEFDKNVAALSAAGRLAPVINDQDSKS